MNVPHGTLNTRMPDKSKRPPAITPQSDLSEYSPRAGDAKKVASLGLNVCKPTTPTADVVDAKSPRVQEWVGSPPALSTTPPKAHHPRPRAVPAVPKLQGIERNDENPRGMKPSEVVLHMPEAQRLYASKSEDEVHILGKASLLGGGLLLGVLLNGFALLFGVVLCGKRRRNYVLGCALGALMQLIVIIIILARAVPMSGPDGMVLVRSSSK